MLGSGAAPLCGDPHAAIMGSMWAMVTCAKCLQLQEQEPDMYSNKRAAHHTIVQMANGSLRPEHIVALIHWWQRSHPDLGVDALWGPHTQESLEGYQGDEAVPGGAPEDGSGGFVSLRTTESGVEVTISGKTFRVTEVTPGGGPPRAGLP